MDNMLYIIAGLVLILLVAVLVLRKKKAQETSIPPAIQTGKKAATLTPTAKTTDNTPAHSREDIDKKFDHITIAQRFIDQQRHDKAIETLTRGLNEKPNDSQLLLKLLGIYATLDQPENFNTVYDTIKTQSDPQSITQANELKALFFEEQASVAVEAAPVEDQTNFESIDFDLPISQTDDQNVLSDQPAVQDSNPTWADEQTHKTAAPNEFDQISSTNESVENDFDLTLSDFDNDFEDHGFEEPVTTSAAPVTSSNDIEEESFNTVTVDETTSEDSDIIDFDFDFDSSEADKAPTHTSVASRDSDNAGEDMVLESEEFILDFDDLVTDAETDTITDNKESTVEALNIDSNQNEEDFVLSLDDFDTSNNTETVSESVVPTLEDTNDIDNFILENTDFEDSSSNDHTFENIDSKNSSLENGNLDNNKFEDISLEELRFDDNSVESEIIETPEVTTASEPLLFDDNTVLEEDFEFEPSTPAMPTSSAPVETDSNITFEDETDTESAEDFASRFSADFDFVKSLDSHQVTLDLATQYVQLGEYDSAKRLLNEVIDQGNQEQQHQAKLLLKRTA
ncbi:FimV/HubP family polar landmark protein [Psychrobacter alimentarius]|uniref:FimV/HubP family polar landmark protein n=1 Tax=Psychrobacter alimentarius TaxID=261164 RepID=UPI003FD4F633